MLGGIKGDRTPERVSLFRLLARRWKPVVPVKRVRLARAWSLQSGEQPAPARAWISKPRGHAVFVKPVIRPSRAAWSPWQWVK